MNVLTDTCNTSTGCHEVPKTFTTHIQPEVLILFIFNFVAILLLVLRVYKAEQLISDLINHRITDSDGVESMKKDIEAIKRHKQRITIQENIYQKVLVQVETKTQQLTSMLEAKERLLNSVTEHVAQLAAKYQSSFPEFKKAVSALRQEVSQLHIKLESEVSSLHFRLSSFSSPASSVNCLANSHAPETLYVHRTILPEKNVNDEFVHVPGLGLISTEELDQMDCSFISFDPMKNSKKKRFRITNPLSWIRNKKSKELRIPEETIEEDRASFGLRSRM